MATIKLSSISLFAALLASLVPTIYMQESIYEFVSRLRHHLASYPSDLTFTMRSFVLKDLEWTSAEFQKFCMSYEKQYGNPAVALNKAIHYVFDDYKQNYVSGKKDMLQKIEKGDPIGFNIYLTTERVDNNDSDFATCISTFYDTMQARIRLQEMRNESNNIPRDIRYRIATEYQMLSVEAINYFIKLAAKKSKKKMYDIDCIVLDNIETYTNWKVDDVQILLATHYDEYNAMIPNLHAVCINYKATTNMVHVYDSAKSGILEGRQKGIIQKLYPDRYIKFEKSTGQLSNATCAVFAITYATMLLNGKDPATNPLKLNEVHGDEAIYMRIHIMDMLSKQKIFLPNY